MNDYILLMHNDGDNVAGADWEAYISNLRSSENFKGGSSIGRGISVSKGGTSEMITGHLTGYIIVKAQSLQHAQQLVTGNPLFEAGGTVEVRELPED